MVADIHRNVVAGQEVTNAKHQSVRSAFPAHKQQNSDHFLDSSQVSSYGYRGSAVLRSCSVPLGELPPPPPGACFGRDNLIEEIVGLAENLKPIALIGAGGIGKTSIALAVLHHDHIKDRFGDNRRFIRCDQFPASSAHFLARLSKVVGAGVENPEDLVPLRPLLSSQEMLIVLDNAESILDPHGTNAHEIDDVVDELSRFKTICLLITSRITTVPGLCKRPVIPTLSMEAACDVFYSIYGDGGRSDIIEGLLRRLDFHALSITLLATTAFHNAWDYGRLAEEWDAHHAQVLRTHHNKSLEATIELSLASPTFCTLSPHARDLLGVIAFFPQGVDEKNLDWLFPTVPDRKRILDKFCALSLSHRSNGFVNMLAPIRDYFRPPNPESFPLLCATKDHYFTRLSVRLHPDRPGFREAVWIRSEDVNVEHLLDVFASVNADEPYIWGVCIDFIGHLYWHKPRQTLLMTKIQGLPDDHPSKPKCLFQLALLFQSLGNCMEQKRFASLALELEKEREGDYEVAEILRFLSFANRALGLYEEGIQQGREALEIYKRHGNIEGQASCLKETAGLLYESKQLDAAEETATRAIDLLPEKGEEFQTCQFHTLLGNIYRSKGEREGDSPFRGSTQNRIPLQLAQ